MTEHILLGALEKNEIFKGNQDILEFLSLEHLQLKTIEAIEGMTTSVSKGVSEGVAEGVQGRGNVASLRHSPSLAPTLAVVLLAGEVDEVHLPRVRMALLSVVHIEGEHGVAAT